MNLSDYSIKTGSTIIEAMDVIQKATSRSICVLNPAKKIVGILSQGDILWALLEGSTPYSLIDPLIKPNFTYLNDYDIEKAYKIIKETGFSILPIVDQSFKLTGVITIRDIFAYVDNLISGV